MGVNIVIFSGNVGTDPEYKEVSETRAVCKFSVASNRKWGKEENQQETTWLDVECWGATAKFVSDYVTRGREISCVGRLQKDTWEDKEGNSRSKIKLVADSVQPHGAKGGSDNSGGKNTAEIVEQVLTLMESGIDKETALKAVSS